MVALTFSFLLFAGTAAVLADGSALRSRSNLLLRADPKVGLAVKIISSKATYEEECETDGLMPMLDPGASGTIAEVDESGAGSVLLKVGNDEAWVPIRAMVGFENWAKGADAAIAVLGGPSAPHKLCADSENKDCACKGTVFYGQKFAEGKPGAGEVWTYKEFKDQPLKEKKVTTSIKCNNAAFGGDPAPGYYKQCWCEPSPVPKDSAMSFSAPAVDTKPTDFLPSGCQQAQEVTDTYKLDLGMSSRACFMYCRKKEGTKYFGVTGGGVCFCSVLPPGRAVAKKECDLKCSGNPREICGGVNRVSSVYTMVNCDKKTDEEKGYLATAKRVKLTKLYGSFDAQSCGQAKNNHAEIDGSTKMLGSPDECKVACFEGKGAEKCDGFTYNKVLGRCRFFKDVLHGEHKMKEGLTCYWKKMGYPE